MTNPAKQGADDSINSERLAALLDKLVAVALYLEPICRLRRDGDRLPLASAHDAIAGACQILRSAIGDLRDFIHHIDGLKYLLPAIDMQPGSEVGRSAGFSYRLARLFLLPRRWSHQAGSPKSDHLLCTFRHDGRRSALCFRSRSATCRPHYRIGSDQPHTHKGR